MDLGWWLIIIFAVIQFIVDQQKKAKQRSEKQQKKQVVVPNDIEQAAPARNNREGYYGNSSSLNSYMQQPRTVKEKRTIIDREAEILNKDFAPSRENLVQDVIFAEILQKPKSKR